jgi:hypothetical protein
MYYEYTQNFLFLQNMCWNLKILTRDPWSVSQANDCGNVVSYSNKFYGLNTIKYRLQNGFVVNVIISISSLSLFSKMILSL